MRDNAIEQISVISGKGGTGKTSFVAAFSCIESGMVLADCDVDAADLHLLVCSGPERAWEAEPFVSGVKAVIDVDLCIGCGRCSEVCRFHAVKKIEKTGPGGDSGFQIAQLHCEGCGCCHDDCPTGAVSLADNFAGNMFVSPSRSGTLIHARLGPGEGASGKLVARVREKAKEIAGQENARIVLIDGSPGIGCPVIASITGSDAVLIVTEPTVSGLHDLNRVLDLCDWFKISAYVVVNKSDINSKMTDSIIGNCLERGVEILGSVPYDPVFVEAVNAGVSVVDYNGSEVVENLWNIWSRLLTGMREGR